MSRGIPFDKKTLVMGVINVTPDSFYSGSRVFSASEAVERALHYEQLGADIIDVGGESTRPGSKGISADEELKRVIPVIEGIRKKSDIIISVDTHKPLVAERAIECGVQIINDISGLRFSNGIEQIVAKSGTYIILMHIRGKPFDMQKRALYYNVVEEVSDELDVSIKKALTAGIKRQRIILDPGIGFAKLAEHNLHLLKGLPYLKRKGYPILIGLSRKSFLGAYTNLEPEQRLIPTVAANAISIFQGADIIRVHDVKEAVETVKIVDAIKNC